MVRAYAWRMTVERLLRILISAIRNQGFQGPLRPTSFRCAPSASALSSSSSAVSSRCRPIRHQQQAGIGSASQDLQERLARAHADYEARVKHVFSSQPPVAPPTRSWPALTDRLGHDPDT